MPTLTRNDVDLIFKAVSARDMRLSSAQERMIREAGKTNGSRVYGADFAPHDPRRQSAFHRTCTSLVRLGLMEQSRYSNRTLMNAYELTVQGRAAFELLRAGKPLAGLRRLSE